MNAYITPCFPPSLPPYLGLRAHNLSGNHVLPGGGGHIWLEDWIALQTRMNVVERLAEKVPDPEEGGREGGRKGGRKG